jgi:hypothetical protein
MKFVFTLWSALSMPLAAGTVSLDASSTLPPDLQPGTTQCSQDVPVGLASCRISAFFSDPAGRNTAAVFATAAADHGAISGDVFVAIDSGNASASYQSAFADLVTVLGGSGVGTLITHYHLVSFDDEERAEGLGLPPSYQFQQGGTSVDYTPDLPHPNTNPVSTLTEDFDVTSPFIFGEPFGLSASTRAVYLNPMGPARAYTLETSSSAQITGYTVLDLSGAVVAEATIQRDSIPEPATKWLALAGCLSIATMNLAKRKAPRGAGNLACSRISGGSPRTP